MPPQRFVQLPRRKRAAVRPPAGAAQAGRIRMRLDVERVTNGVTESVGHRVLLLGVDNAPASLPAV